MNPSFHTSSCELTSALGSFIERKRCALTWHYRQAEDQVLGSAESLKMHTELESWVTKKWEVDVMKGKANLEVRPTFINKGEIAKRLVLEHSNPSDPSSKLEFILCLGDDFTDEDMFRALNAIGEDKLKGDHVFTVTVGSSNKITLAKWHLLEPEDVVETVALLAGVGLSGEPGEPLSQVNLATVASLEGRIPE